MQWKHNYTEKPILYVVSWVSFIVLALVLLVGYTSNIAKLFMIPDTLMMLVLRTIGLMIPPLGGVIGYL